MEAKASDYYQDQFNTLYPSPFPDINTPPPSAQETPPTEKERLLARTKSYSKKKFSTFTTKMGSGIKKTITQRKKKRSPLLPDFQTPSSFEKEQNPVSTLQLIVANLEKSHEDLTIMLEKILGLYKKALTSEKTPDIKVEIKKIRKTKKNFQNLLSYYKDTKSTLIQLKKIESLSSVKLSEVSKEWKEEPVVLVEKEEGLTPENERLLKLKAFYLESIPKLISLVKDIIPRIEAQLLIISYAKVKNSDLVQKKKELMQLLEEARTNHTDEGINTTLSELQRITGDGEGIKNNTEKKLKKLKHLIKDLEGIVETNENFKAEDEDREKEEERRNNFEIPAVSFCSMIAQQSKEAQLLVMQLEDSMSGIATTVFQIEVLCKPLEKGGEIKAEIRTIILELQKILDNHFNPGSSQQDLDWKSTLFDLQKRYSQVENAHEAYSAILPKKLEKIKIQVLLSPDSQFEAKKAYQKQHDTLLKRLVKLNCQLALAPFKMGYLEKTITAFDESKALCFTLSNLASEAKLSRVIRTPKEKSHTCPAAPNDEHAQEKLTELIDSYETATGMKSPYPTIWHRLRDKKQHKDIKNPSLIEINLQEFYDKSVAKQMEKKLAKTLQAIQYVQMDQRERFKKFEKMIDEADRNVCKEINLLARGIREGEYKPEGFLEWVSASLQQDVFAVTPLAKRRGN